MAPEEFSGELGLLIEERARDYEREMSESGNTDIVAYLDGLDGDARSSLIARLVEVEEGLRSGDGETPGGGAATLPRHARFRLIREIGAGGMGVVYEAWDRERQMSVALKTVHHLSPGSLMLFKQEFRSLAKLVHPNLVSLYELFSDGEQWFFSMEFVANAIDIRQALRAGFADDDSDTDALTVDLPDVTVTPDGSAPSVPIERADLDFERARSIFAQMADGVIALHDADKLHRDLKPGNVLVGPGDRVFLLDFGLVADVVRQPDSGDGDTDRGVVPSTGAAVGTIGYMAPEQATGKPLTTAGDWYAFGVMLFEVLTGHLPFEGSKVEKIRRKLTEQAVAPSTINPAVPPDLDMLCLKLLQLDPEQRPEGDEVLGRLTRGIRRRAVPAPEQRHFVGRERELAALRVAQAKASEGETTILYLHGRSGVGKSALVQKFLSEVSNQPGSMILAGRCYEQETVPYKAFDSVVDTLATELLRMPPHEVAAILPPGIAALARIFPVLGTVPAIAARGREPLGQDLEGLRRRAFTALRSLLSKLARSRTLVIHIDDLQWGDLDSADLLAELLMPDARPPLLLLLTYRSEYLDRSPSLAAVSKLGEEEGSGLLRNVLQLDQLSTAETRMLATRILLPFGSPEQVEWIVQESEGIAFFVYELALFARDAEPQQIESGADLEQVLWSRIARFPEPACRLLEVVAVAAQPLSLRSAQAAAEVGMLAPEVLASLRAGNLLRGSGTGLDDQVESYHDRVREIVSGGLEAEQLRSIHAALADTLELHSEGGPERLARHYFESGQLESAGRNFEAAADQAVQAVAFDRAEEFYQRSIELATTVEERARRQEKIIHFYTNAARFEDAYRVGREALVALGISIPATFHGPPFVADLARARIRLGRRTIPSLIDLPTSEDQKHTLAIRLLSAIGKAAYQIRPELCIAVLVKSVNACLAKGNTRDAAVGFMAFGAIFVGGILGRYRDGYDFGRLSLDLVDKYDDDVHRAEVNFVVGYFGTSWLKSSREAEQLFERAFEAGQQSGDLFHTGCACAAGTMHRFMRGAPLDELEEEVAKHVEFLGRLQLRETLGCVRSVGQAIRNLRGETASKASLSDHEFNEAEFIAELKEYGSRHFAHYHHINRMICAAHWNEIGAGLAAANASMEYLKDSKGMLHSTEQLFYRALIVAAALREGRGRGHKDRAVLKAAWRRFSNWARLGEENFKARACLLEAELARLDRRPHHALSLFAEAANTATRYDQLQIAALAHRGAAQILRLRGEAALADSERREAARCYREWGSEALAELWGKE